MTDSKRCIECFVMKRLDQYYRNKDSSDGHINTCIKCKCATAAARKAQPSQNSLLLQRWAENTRRSNNNAML